MYSKEELQAKSVVQLKDIAKELGVKVKKSDNKETIVYAILDAQAEQPAPEAAPKRKRTRIATKKEDSKPIRRRHRGSGTCQLPETPRQKKQGRTRSHCRSQSSCHQKASGSKSRARSADGERCTGDG